MTARSRNSAHDALRVRTRRPFASPRRPSVPGAVLAAALLVGCGSPASVSEPLYRAPAVSNVVDGVTWEAGDWKRDLAPGKPGTSRGNHRAVVELDSALVGATPATAVAVTIPWRRSDPHPEAKSVLVVDATTGDLVANMVALHVDNVSGEVVLQPSAGSTVYYVYYMPWTTTGGPYPKVTYPPDLAPTPDRRWSAHVTQVGLSNLPRGRTTRIQSITAFHSFFPMEVIASPDEERAFMADAPQGWRVVAEPRDRPVRMRHFIPQHWTRYDRPDAFESQVLRDESFTFQVALVSGDAPLSHVRVAFAGFPDGWAWTCFNCGGIDELGRPFTKEVDVPAEQVQPLWLGVRVPTDQPAGPVNGTVTVSTAERGSESVAVSLQVRDATAANRGEDEPDLMTRLAWLNSTAGEDPDYIVPPFEPIAADGETLAILGRRITLGPSGLPSAIESFFTPELTSLSDTAEPILAAPLELDVVAGGGPVAFRSDGLTMRSASPGRASWTARGTADDGLSLAVDGTLEYDGMLEVHMALVSDHDVSVDDIDFPVRYAPGAAKYMLGLGRMGGLRPTSLDWKWDVEKNQDGVWLGGINRGLQYVLRAENYVRPLNTNFYHSQPLNMPPSWFNGGRGGIRIREEGGAVVAHNYSGPRTLTAGDTLHFDVRFLITPFKPIDTHTHFRTRFVHQYVPVDSVVAWGGTVVNIHHATAINPYINYPFYNLDQQKAYVDEAHEKGVKVKLYYTIRELTYKAHELFPVRSLGDEVFNDGDGGGYSWLQEHLKDHYHAAWRAYQMDDAAILDKGTSRWTNYYVRGLQWLAHNQHIDGLYLDDIAFGRATMRRMVTVLYQERPDVVIDLHSANQFNPRDGFNNSAMLYMEHFPYISRLWFGEYFDYSRKPDYWMTEVSGLPFGLMGEMLQGGGRPYRGMLYGMTARKYGDTDPRPVWRMMDDFGIADSRMLGYWLDDTPVRTGRDDILATTYVRDDRVLIALASWSDRDQVVSLRIDRRALGLGSDAQATAPAVRGLQEAGPVDLSAVDVPADKGLWIVVPRTSSRR